MLIWNDRKEKGLLGFAGASLALLITVKLHFALATPLLGTTFGNLISSEAFSEVLGDLLVGLISAYIFYLLIDLWPRAKRERSIQRLLNLLLTSVVDAYERTRVFGHETAIAVLDTSILKPQRLEQHIDAVRAARAPSVMFLKLKFAMETAHSRYSDFQGTLGMATELSPEHALAWLGVTDKIRLLAEAYGTQPLNPWVDNFGCKPTNEELIDEKVKENYDIYQNSMKDFESTLQLRVMEFFEEAKDWILMTKCSS
ncbi:hypothetical protein VD17_03140 [Pseudomonas fluorescens]|uniref:Uncharacterized protein n=2 Tax=Pseudomonas fluorescens TaxID=294 RepID=A0A0F4VEM4_PSEFL|nr:hypothetical protein VD17_03140 [Pseudomonas fluorescens]